MAKKQDRTRSQRHIDVLRRVLETDDSKTLLAAIEVLLQGIDNANHGLSLFHKEEYSKLI